MSTLVTAVAGNVMLTWALFGGALMFKRAGMPCPNLIVTIWAELRPFYLPATFIYVAVDVAHGRIWGLDMVFHVCYVLNWFLFKDVDDDDRWKRRRRKVLEKIRATDRGLVVVPAEAAR